MNKIVAASLIAFGLTVTAAEAKEGVKIGVLSCDIEGGVGFIVGSSKGVDCIFEGGGRVEHYEGTIDKLGIDIGVTKRTAAVWVVFAPGKLKRGALEGSYGGASAEATVLAGIGANVLIGGFENNINLQPLSVQVQTGLNIAAGVAALRLDYVN